MGGDTHFVELTGRNGMAMFVRRDSITAVGREFASDETTIRANGDYYYAKESPAEVLALLGAGDRGPDVDGVRESVESLHAGLCSRIARDQPDSANIIVVQKDGGPVAICRLGDLRKLVSFLDTLTRKD